MAACVCGLALLPACGGRRLVYVKDPGAAAAEAAGLAQAVLFEGFEGVLPAVQGTANTDFGARVAAAVLEGEKAAGRRALRVDFDSGKGSWGVTVAVRRASVLVEASGAALLEFEAWVPAGLSFALALQEAPSQGGDGEIWVSPDLSGKGRWKAYGVPLNRLYKSGWSGNQAGGGRLDTGALAGLELQVAARQGAGSLYLDEVRLR